MLSTFKNYFLPRQVVPPPTNPPSGRPKRNRNLTVWAFKMRCAGLSLREIQAWLTAAGVRLRDPRGRRPENPYYQAGRQWADDGGVTLAAAIEARLTAAVIDGGHRVEGFAAIASKFGMSRERLTYGLYLLFPELAPQPIETVVCEQEVVRGQMWTGLPCKPASDDASLLEGTAIRSHIEASLLPPGEAGPAKRRAARRQAQRIMREFAFPTTAKGLPYISRADLDARLAARKAAIREGQLQRVAALRQRPIHIWHLPVK